MNRRVNGKAAMMMASTAARVAPNDVGRVRGVGGEDTEAVSTVKNEKGAAGFGAVVPGAGGSLRGSGGSLEPYAYDAALLKRATTEGRRYLLDALRFLFFLALFTFTSMASENNQDLYWLGGQVSEFFEKSELLQRDESFPVTLNDVRTEHEVWKYISGVFYPTLYGAATWDDDAAFKKTSSSSSSSSSSSPPSSSSSSSSSSSADWRTNHNNRPGWVMGGARMVGGARIGTVR